jgi:uncharacterized protein
MNREHPFLIIRTRTIIYWFLLIVGIFVGVLGFNTNLILIANANLDATTELILVSVIIYGFIWLWCWQQKQESSLNLSCLFGRLPPPRQWVPLLFLNIPILLFSIGTGQLIFYLLYLYQPSLLEQIFLSEGGGTRSSLYYLVYLIVVVIIAPLFEEIFFRGFILQRFAIKWGNGVAIVLSSIFFGLLHLNPIGLFLFSIVMSLAYFKTNCLWVPIVMHATNNFFAFTLLLLADYAVDSNETIDVSIFQNYWQYSLIFISLSLPLLAIFIYKNWTKKRQQIIYLDNHSKMMPTRKPLIKTKR